MTIRSILLMLAALVLTLFCAQPVLAHCGKCGMGEGKQHGEMHDQQHQDSDCRQLDKVKHDCDDCQVFELKDKPQARLKCDCENGDHQGHHGMHGDLEHEHHHGHQGGGDVNLDELFEKDQS
jgi:hypothetical protein